MSRKSRAADIVTDDQPYTESEVRAMLRLRDPGTLPRWRKAGTAPPFFRLGAKHSRVLYPRREFWAWIEQRIAESSEQR